MHSTHRTRFSIDASTFDEICELCGATDKPGGWGRLAEPCPAPESDRAVYDERKSVSSTSK